MEKIKLSEAPERFFESSKWASCVAVFEGRDRAVAWLNERDGGMIDYYGQLAADNGHEPARRRLDVQKMVTALVADLNARLTRGVILASGFTQATVERVLIPPERWPGLRLDFVGCRAEGQVTFEQVLLWLPEKTSAELEADCATWLSARKAEGASLKKSLLAEALAKFPRLKSREFDAAFKQVFDLPRGRPRKAKIEK